jgi:hypothetical protein
MIRVEESSWIIPWRTVEKEIDDILKEMDEMQISTYICSCAVGI